MYSNIWFVSGGVVRSNAFVRWISLSVLQLFLSTPGSRTRYSRFKRRHIVAVMLWKSSPPVEAHDKKFGSCKGQLSAAVDVVPLSRIALVSSAHGDSRGKKGVLCFWAASGGCDHDEKSMIHGERWVGVGVGPVVHDAFAHLLSIPNMRKTTSQPRPEESLKTARSDQWQAANGRVPTRLGNVHLGGLADGFAARDLIFVHQSTRVYALWQVTMRAVHDHHGFMASRLKLRPAPCGFSNLFESPQTSVM